MWVVPLEQTERHRRECEAREWLRRGYSTGSAVEGLMRDIARQRGQESADRLRAEMRRQWARRSEWLSK